MKEVNQLPNAYLHESVKIIDRLSKRVCAYLQIDSVKHSMHVLQRRQEIVIIVEEPILANQLKYQQKAILMDLNQALLCEFKTIKIKLSPPRMRKIAIQRINRPLPVEITQLLDSVRSDLESS